MPCSAANAKISSTSSFVKRSLSLCCASGATFWTYATGGVIYSYVDANGDKQYPIMLHRALFGSLERFAGILIEHYAGRFPVWLAPVQAAVLPISDRHVEFGARVTAELRELGVRVELDRRSESIGKKVRDAELGRNPFMLVVGDREEETGEVSVRSHAEGELGTMTLPAFADLVRREEGKA